MQLPALDRLLPRGGVLTALLAFGSELTPVSTLRFVSSPVMDGEQVLLPLRAADIVDASTKICEDSMPNIEIGQRRRLLPPAAAGANTFL